MELTPRPQVIGTGKKAFHKTALRVYGTVGEITGALTVGGPPDSAENPKNNMTRPAGAPPDVPTDEPLPE